MCYLCLDLVMVSNLVFVRVDDQMNDCKELRAREDLDIVMIGCDDNGESDDNNHGGDCYSNSGGDGAYYDKVDDGESDNDGASDNDYNYDDGNSDISNGDRVGDTENNN